MKNIVLLLVIGTLMQGCANVSQPTASRPLVDKKVMGKTTPVDISINSILDNAKSGESVQANQHSMVLGSKFVSATGLTCRKLVSDKAGLDVYCLNLNNHWFKVKRVISEATQ